MKQRMAYLSCAVLLYWNIEKAAYKMKAEIE